MDLYGDLTGAQVSGNLFIRSTCDHQAEYLLFPGRQRFEPLPQRCDFRLLLTSGAVAFQGNVNRIQQILIAEWFGQELDGSRFHCPHRHGDITVASDKYDRNANVTLGQLALEIEPSDPRQLDIEHQATRRIRTPALQELRCRSEHFYLQPFRFEQALYL